MNKAITVGIIVLVLVVLGIIIASNYWYSTGTTTTTQTSGASTETSTVVSNTTVSEASSTTVSTYTYGLSEDEIAAIKYMAEEEKLAYDVYTKLAELYSNTSIFANIAKSEETHVNAVLSLAKKYGIDIKLGAPGQFNNTHMQELYEQLVSQGKKSLEDALIVGATIEEVDIVDISEWLTKVTHDDIKQVFSCLMMGSRNHLRAFTSTLKNLYGVEYTPQYLSMEEYEQIINSPMEKGSMSCSQIDIDV